MGIATCETHPDDGVHLRRCDLLGSLYGAHDLLLVLNTRTHNVETRSKTVVLAMPQSENKLPGPHFLNKMEDIDREVDRWALFAC